MGETLVKLKCDASILGGSYSIKLARHLKDDDIKFVLHFKGWRKDGLSVRETKGEHLKGNDVTDYKQKLFELLTSYVETATKAGQLELDDDYGKASYTMLLENSWKQELIDMGIK